MPILWEEYLYSHTWYFNFDVGREKSIIALWRGYGKWTASILTTQKDPEIDPNWGTDFLPT